MESERNRIIDVLQVAKATVRAARYDEDAAFELLRRFITRFRITDTKIGNWARIVQECMDDRQNTAAHIRERDQRKAEEKARAERILQELQRKADEQEEVRRRAEERKRVIQEELERLKERGMAGCSTTSRSNVADPLNPPLVARASRVDRWPECKYPRVRYPQLCPYKASHGVSTRKRRR